jgi:hypothetical protein
MRYLIRALALLPILALTGCGGGGGDPANTLLASETLGREFVLGYGETVDAGPLALEFVSVDDTRCGSSSPAVCAWEGNASIVVSATNGPASQMLTLNSNSRFATSAIFAGHVIELRRLDPQPRYTTRPGLDEYTATLFVDDWATQTGG